jgi:hypothetical protein
MHTTRSIAILALATALGGCASVNSTMNAKETDGGLVYYMPMRDIVITVTNAGGKINSIVTSASASYADRSKAYVLDYQRHPLAKNTLDVEVSEAGLLTNSKSNQTGDAVAALGGLGTLAGYMRASSISIQSDPTGVAKTKVAGGACSLDGNHTFIIPVTRTQGDICNGISFRIEKLGWTGDKGTDTTMNQREGTSYAGVFYRVNMPYKVTVFSDTLNSETIVFSPSQSQEYFLPIARTFFANNDSKITLANGAGVPSKYVQDTDGEVAALLKLPAAIVAPYFAAIGQLFTGFSSKNTSEASALNSTLSLELTKMKFDACIKAIQDKDTERIASLKCGE